MVDSQLRHAFTDWLGITGIASGQSFDPNLDASPGLNVTQAIKPLSEDVSFTNLNHWINVAMRLHVVKLQSTRIFEQFASAVMPQ